MMNELDIDSARFDSQKYVSNFLKNHTVQDLIKKHNSLQSEIKDYDQEIQALVFENYSKFISSIDTVKKMRVDITKIDQKVGQLQESMSKISVLSRRIDSQLSVKRDEIIKLDTVNKDLSKLNNVCNFSNVIQKELDEYRIKKDKNFDQYFNETAHYYKNCYSTLETNKNEPLIQPIYKETNQKLESIRQILWNSLMEFKQQNPLLQLYSESKVSISTQEARSAVKKLIQIMEDEEAVLRHYQKIIKERYLTVSKELIDKAAITKSSEIVNLMDYLEEKRYEYSVEELEEYKLTREKEIVNTDSSIQGSILWLINQICQVIFKELKAEVSFLLIEIRATLRDKSLEVLSAQVLKEIIHGVFQGVTDKMSQKKINNVQVNEVFVKLQCELQSLFENDSIRLQLRTEIIDKFAENVENICRGQVFTSFSHLRIQFLELLAFAKNDLQKMQQNEDVKRDIMTLITVIKQKLLAYTTIRLLDLKAFVFSQQQNYLREQETYLNLIQASLMDFVKFIAKIFAFRSIQMSQEQLNHLFNDQYIIQQVLPLLATNDSTQYYLLSNQFLQIFSKTLSFKLLDLMQSVFQGYKIRQPTESELNRIKATINSSMSKNLMIFAQVQAETWISKMYQYLNNQTNIVYEQQISQKEILIDVKNFVEALGLLFPDTKRGLVKKSSFIEQSSFNFQMEVLMAKKCRTLELNVNDRNSLLITVVKYFLKVLIQKVRKTYFKEDCYKQFQVDLYFVMQLMYELVSVDEEGLICGFYVEILDCASKNSDSDFKVDNKLLEQLSNQTR